MIPVTQDLFGKQGNCFAACVASILEMPLHAVPNVGWMDDWSLRINWWLRRRGLFFVELAWDQEFIAKHFAGSYLIASGPAVRGFNHGCVYRGTELAHDPHPDRSGLIGLPESWGVLALSDFQLFQTNQPTRERLRRMLWRVDEALRELDSGEAVA